VQMHGPHGSDGRGAACLGSCLRAERRFPLVYRTRSGLLARWTAAVFGVALFQERAVAKRGAWSPAQGTFNAGRRAARRRCRCRYAACGPCAAPLQLYGRAPLAAFGRGHRSRGLGLRCARARVCVSFCSAGTAEAQLELVSYVILWSFLSHVCHLFCSFFLLCALSLSEGTYGRQRTVSRTPWICPVSVCLSVCLSVRLKFSSAMIFIWQGAWGPGAVGVEQRCGGLYLRDAGRVADRRGVG
jgi:hypothetical protein